MCRYFIVPKIYSDCAAFKPHVTTVKHIIQCQAASFDSKTSHLPLYRQICENPVSIAKGAGGDEDTEKETGKCPACLGAGAIAEASGPGANVYFVHAYRGIRLRERPHITDVGHATSTLEQDISKARLPELDLHDLHLAFDSGNRPTHQELDTDSPQKLLAEANKPGQSSPEIPIQSLENPFNLHWRDPTGPLPQLARSFRRTNAPSTAFSSNMTSSVFSKQSHQSAVTDGTSVSGYDARRWERTIGGIGLRSVPEKREPISEESDSNEKTSLVPDYNNLNAEAIREHMENSWIEAEVDGEVFYVNYFYRRKTQWEKPRNAFIKVLPQTEKFRGEPRRQIGREKYTAHFREKEPNKGKKRRRDSDGGDRSDRGEDCDSNLLSGPAPTSHQKEEPPIKPDQVMITSSKEEATRRNLQDLTQSETIGGTKLYQAVHRGFKEIIGGVSKPSDDGYKTLEPFLLLKTWMEPHLTRLSIWSQEVGVEEAALDSLADYRAYPPHSDLHKTLTEYLISVYEALKVIDQNICESLYNLALVEKHSAIHQFVLKTTRESIASNLEEIDALLDQLFLLVDPIKIFLALETKSGPYATVVDAVGELELDSEC